MKRKAEARPIMRSVKPGNDNRLAQQPAAAIVTALGELRVRRALAIARLPLPLRRLLIWLSLNIGRQVPNFMGTFAISALGSHGARSSTPSRSGRAS